MSEVEKAWSDHGDKLRWQSAYDLMKDGKHTGQRIHLVVLTDYRNALKAEITEKIMGRYDDNKLAQAYAKSFGSLTMKDIFKIIDTTLPPEQ